HVALQADQPLRLRRAEDGAAQGPDRDAAAARRGGAAPGAGPAPAAGLHAVRAFPKKQRPPLPIGEGAVPFERVLLPAQPSPSGSGRAVTQPRLSVGMMLESTLWPGTGAGAARPRLFFSKTRSAL